MGRHCVLDCETEAGIITLRIDPVSPDFLFIEIGGELRKCADLREYALRFEGGREAAAFLEKVRASDFLRELIEEEKRLNQGWDEL